MKFFSKNFSKNRKTGLALVEVVIGTAIISAAILAASTAYSTYVSYALRHQRSVQAIYLIGEEIEAVTFLRDKGWTENIATLSNDVTYYIIWDSYWKATTTPQYVDGQFLRMFSLSAVYRDGQDRIASSGTLDPDTRLVTASISYVDGKATTTDTMSTYITNLYGN